MFLLLTNRQNAIADIDNRRQSISPMSRKFPLNVPGLLNYNLRTQVDGPDAVISWEISLSSELLLFYFIQILSTVMHAC